MQETQPLPPDPMEHWRNLARQISADPSRFLSQEHYERFIEIVAFQNATIPDVTFSDGSRPQSTDEVVQRYLAAEEQVNKNAPLIKNLQSDLDDAHMEIKRLKGGQG